MSKKMHAFSMTFRSNLKFTELCVLSLNFLKGMLGIDDESYFKIEISLREAVNNAITHGNENDPEKQVHIDFHWDRALLRITVRDECPRAVEFAAIEERMRNNDLLAFRGRGILIMKNYMDHFEFIPGVGGNTVVLEKRLP